jgi:hypothetical protein
LNKEPSDLQSKHAQEQGKLDRMVQEITMVPLAGSGLRELATEIQELLLGKINLVLLIHSKCSPAPALH